MRFAFTERQEALRLKIQQFIAEYVTQDVKRELLDHEAQVQRGPALTELFKQIGDRGWLAISWPEEWGGQGGSRIDQYIVEEEFGRAGIYVGGAGTGALAVLSVGTPEQKAKYVPAAIRGEIFFAMGYSEPGAGADLANVQCRAERQGDEYVVNGQKTFTTHAHLASHIYLMVRTDATSRRQAGISILLVPMETPGITVSPLWTVQNNPTAPLGTIYGEPRTNEVFFDDVHVPEGCLLGRENEGWSIGQQALNLDRVGATRYLMSVMQDESFLNWMKNDRGLGARLREDATVRALMAEMWVEAQVCRLMTMRSMSIAERDGDFTYEGAAEKVFAPEHAVRSTEIITRILGPSAQLLAGSPGAIQSGLFAHNLLGAYQSCVNHGSVQIMRDQVARRGLSLPKA